MELARCTELANAAHAAGMLVVGAHVEGMARRTDANDQASIDGILALSDAVLVIDKVEYEVDFRVDCWEYDYDIDAQTGEIRSWDKDWDD